MIQAVIFDLDGTLVDTERLWGGVMKRFTEHHGKRVDPAVRVKMMGKRDQEALMAFKEHYELPQSVEELVESRRQFLQQDSSLISVNEGVYELLDLLDALGIKKAVATSATEGFAHRTLEQFGLFERMDAVVTADDVVRSKPDPEIYLEAAKRLGVSPENCLVIEDAEIGVESGYSAGMKVFAIPHSDSRSHDFSHATKVLSSMLEVDEKLIRSL